MWKIRVLAKIANILGVQFKIDGLPFGADYDRHKKNFGDETIWNEFAAGGRG